LPDVRELLTFARHLLSNLKATYLAARPQRKDLLAALVEKATLTERKVRTHPRGHLLTYLAANSSREFRMVPVRGYQKGCSGENVEFVGIAA
jgi:hypothetical protein